MVRLVKSTVKPKSINQSINESFFQLLPYIVSTKTSHRTFCSLLYMQAGCSGFLDAVATAKEIADALEIK